MNEIPHRDKVQDRKHWLHGHKQLKQGRRPRGTVPPKFEVGGRPMHWSPQYFEK